MRCFTHPQTDAVAQCSQCQKGICTACAHDAGGATLCSSCCEIGIRAEITHAQSSIVGVWVFTGIVTTIALFIAFGSISQNGAAAILFIPLAFVASWCLFWGWLPVWNGFRKIFAGWGCFGSWTFLLIIAAVTAEILVWIALLVGAFTGIQKYNEARQVVANGNRMIAALYATPIQPTSGT